MPWLLLEGNVDAEAGRETGALWGWAAMKPALQAALRSAPEVRANIAGEQTRQEDGGAFGSLQLASSVGRATDRSIPVVLLLKSAVALHSFQQKGK